MSDLIFREEDHSYWAGGKRLEGVTSILNPLKDFSKIPRDILEKACLFGTAVHKVVELYLAKRLNEATLDDNLHFPLLAFKAFQEDHAHLDWDLCIVEKPMYHRRFWYAGTPDLVFPTNKVIIDIKTRVFDPLVDPLQLEAYQKMVQQDYPGDYKLYVLNLMADGSWGLVKANNKEAWNRFRFLLDYRKMTQEIERW